MFFAPRLLLRPLLHCAVRSGQYMPGTTLDYIMIMLFVSFWSSVSMLCSLWTTSCWLFQFAHIATRLGELDDRSKYRNYLNEVHERVVELKLWWVISHVALLLEFLEVKRFRNISKNYISSGMTLYQWFCSPRQEVLYFHGSLVAPHDTILSHCTGGSCCHMGCLNDTSSDFYWKSSQQVSTPENLGIAEVGDGDNNFLWVDLAESSKAEKNQALLGNDGRLILCGAWAFLETQHPAFGELQSETNGYKQSVHMRHMHIYRNSFISSKFISRVSKCLNTWSWQCSRTVPDVAKTYWIWFHLLL